MVIFFRRSNMKKILPLLLSLFSFVACDNVSNNNAEFVSFEEAVTAECITTVEAPTTIVLSDGTWSIVQIIKSLNSRDSQKMDYTVEAKAGIYTVTYEKSTRTRDISNLSDEEIEEMKNKTNEELGYPSDASVIWNNDKTVTISHITPKEQLSDMRQQLYFSNHPSGTIVKTNADNTKYVVELIPRGATNLFYYSKN